ncbi:MAG: S8 family serine peptidase [Gammaproteobacteria bacterium]|nr:S8 family serine peptidase [Gammaproteobacteria bacterium]
MKKKFKWRKALELAVPLGLALAFSVGAAGKPKPHAVELSASNSQLTVVGEAAGPNEMAAIKPSGGDFSPGVYIIQLAEPSVATYTGGISGYKATSRYVTGERRLNTNSGAAKKYSKYLKTKQAAFIADCDSSLGHAIDVKFTYQHALNGVAMVLTPGEAESVASMPGVKTVSRERFEVPLTDAGPEFIDAPFILTGPPNNVPHSRGEGVVIGVLDTGTNFDHPSFADIGGDGFDHTNPLGSGNYVPGSYCDVTDPNFCNDKLIGAWTFVPGDPNFPVPEADDGHGVHTSSTAAGNVVSGAATFAPTGASFIADVTGVAPHANVIAYDVCVVTCPGSALVAAVNQVIIDSGNLPNGIAAINYSISGGSNPYTDAVELGFLAATDAGIYVSASAGNSGPTAGTVAHLSPWVATVAASTHNRSVDNLLINMTSDSNPLAEILGSGFTTGFGPAPIIHARDFPTSNGSSNDTNPGQCLDPFPAGHFSGEIVICDRGTIARVDKGANVLAGGAGGFVLANTAAQGDSIVADPHFLPGVHIGFSNAQVLDAWRTSNANPVAEISGTVFSLDAANGDIMAGFSSRGPGSAFDVLKPDVSAPGVNIMAGEDTDGVTPAPEFGFLSGTSMSSPHHAGAAALVAAVRPDWGPHEIKSAMMMTSTTANTLKEDGVTPTDHFDVGAGRVNLHRAQEAGLVLNESTANFLAADPSVGGDPKTLNVASMQDSVCVEECSWTRTVRNPEGHTTHWNLTASGPSGLDLDVSPARLTLAAGESKTITVSANTTVAPSGWNFAQLDLERDGDGPDLHMPIAVMPATSSATSVHNKRVTQATASSGDGLIYTIDITNGPLSGIIDVTDVVPDGTTFVPGSEGETITNGTTISPFAYNAGTNSLSWSGTLDVSSFGLTPSPSPFGYLPLAALGVPPFDLPGNCDDGGFILGVPAFTYNNATHGSVIWSVNGTLEAGTSSGLAASASNQNMPDPTPPNNLMGPNWTDLNLCTEGDWRVAVFNFIFPSQFTIYEWDNVPLFGDLSRRYSFQIWVENNVSGSPAIWFTYALVSAPLPNLTVGVEDAAGVAGSSRFFNGTGTPPAVGTDLQVVLTVGGTASLSFDAEATCSSSPVVNRADLSSGSTNETAIAVTKCE